MRIRWFLFGAATAFMAMLVIETALEELPSPVIPPEADLVPPYEPPSERYRPTAF